MISPQCSGCWMRKGDRHEVLVMKCRLCLQERNLRKSHVIPEFFYKPLYDGKHRFHVLTTSTEEKSIYLQKGVRERLLCKDCEMSISQVENYARHFFFAPPGPQDVGLQYEQHNDCIVIENIDYQKFKLFQLSILWRASIATSDPFSEVCLGPHEERIRQMLVDQDPGDQQLYPCVMVGILRAVNTPLTEVIMLPTGVRFHGHKGYRFVFGGCAWLFVVSHHRLILPSDDYVLTKDGKLRMPLMNAHDLVSMT